MSPLSGILWAAVRSALLPFSGNGESTGSAVKMKATTPAIRHLAVSRLELLTQPGTPAEIDVQRRVRA